MHRLTAVNDSWARAHTAALEVPVSPRGLFARPVSGYVPVAHDALALVDEESWFAVLDLYKRAHALRWRPFLVTERSLKTKWKMGNSRVWTTLSILESGGLLVVTKGARRRDPTTVQVFDPTPRQREAQPRAQADDHVPAHPDDVRGNQRGNQRGTSNEPLPEAKTDRSVVPPSASEARALSDIIGRVLEREEDEHLSAGREWQLTQDMVTNQFVYQITRLIVAECVVNPAIGPAKWHGKGPDYAVVAKELRRRAS